MHIFLSNSHLSEVTSIFHNTYTIKWSRYYLKILSLFNCFFILCSFSATIQEKECEYFLFLRELFSIWFPTNESPLTINSTSLLEIFRDNSVTWVIDKEMRKVSFFLVSSCYSIKHIYNILNKRQFYIASHRITFICQDDIVIQSLQELNDLFLIS